MTRDQAVARIQQYLGFRGDKATEIQNALLDSQVELEREDELPWFLKTEIASASTVVDEPRVQLPTDFLRETSEDDDEAGLYYYDSTAEEDERWVELDKLDLKTLRAAFQDETGAPEAYSLNDAYFRLGPIPDAVYTLKMIYYYADTTLSTNVENQWLKYAHELMIGKAGQKIAISLRDMVALQAFQAMEQIGRNRLLRENTARNEANRSRMMGGVD